jgi:hypothetical protein
MEFCDALEEKIKIGNKYLGVIHSARLFTFNIQIPNIQRIRDDAKVVEIVEYQQAKMRTTGGCNFMGVINIHYCGETRELFVIDGQHRFEAIKIINSTISIPVSVEYVIVEKMAELRENYNLINKNTPLPEFPETIDKTIPEKVAVFFRDKYPAIWSKSTRARRPHIYFNYFQEALGVLVDKMEIGHANDLQRVVEQYNTKMSSWKPEQYPGDANPGMTDKCKETGMYLGLYPHNSDEYRYDWVKEILRAEIGLIIKKTPKMGGKKAIPKKIKEDAWNRYIGNKRNEVLCICCRTTPITPFTFHAGHMISETNGGQITVDNIRPICSACNLSMGTRNMLDFVAEHYPKSRAKFITNTYEQGIVNSHATSPFWTIGRKTQI